jgi:hypothetical protein
MSYNHGYFGGNRSVTKSSLLLSPKVFRPFLGSHCRGVTGILDATLPHHTTQPVQVSSKSGSNNGHFTLEPGKVFRFPSRLHCSGVMQTSNVALPPYGAQPREVWSKSVSNKGHFTLEAETVFRPRLASNCSWETQTSHVALSPSAP